MALLCILPLHQEVASFATVSQSHHVCWFDRITRSSRVPLRSNPQEDDEGNLEIDKEDGLPEELAQPFFALQRKSLLFDDDDKSSNGVADWPVRLWQGAITRLPQVVTGAQNQGDNNNTSQEALGRLYNVIFVRLPILCAGLVYGTNEATGHPLVVDVGQGPFEISPLVVGGLFWLLLRY
jgi:hypothetical protein